MSDSALDELSGWSSDSLLATIIEREVKDFRDVLAHENRVASAAVELGASIGMDADSLELLRTGARFHDVGKMLIPRSILDKPGKLDADERKVIESHAQKGAEMLSAIPGMPVAVVDIAHYHHERYDGLGYHGLVGEAIPYMARIVAIADVFDALSSKRAYKEPMSLGDVLELMTRDVPSEAGLGRRAFDPVLLRAFVASRLANDPDGITVEQWRRLEDFASSDPRADLSAELADAVEFHADGSRTVHADGLRLMPSGIAVVEERALSA